SSAELGRATVVQSEKMTRPAAIRQPPMRVNITWPSGDRAGRARLSEAAGSPANHRPVRLNAFAIICFASCGPTLATVLGLTGCSYVRDPAVSERHPLPPPSPDCYQNHAPLQPRTPSYVDPHGQPPHGAGFRPVIVWRAT